MTDLIERIDTLVGTCQHCQGPLGDSPSEDFCSEKCQQRWQAGIPQHYEVRQHGDGWIVYDLLHGYPVADVHGEVVVWADRFGPDYHINCHLERQGWEPYRPSAEEWHEDAPTSAISAALGI